MFNFGQQGDDLTSHRRQASRKEYRHLEEINPSQMGGYHRRVLEEAVCFENLPARDDFVEVGADSLSSCEVRRIEVDHDGFDELHHVK